MKRALGFILCVMLVIIITGCGNKKETTKNEKVQEDNKIEKTTSDYKVEFEDKTRNIIDKVSATYNVVKVSNSKKNKESDKINSYLSEKVDTLYKEYEEAVKNDYVKDASYVFEFKYSLEEQNDYYIIFKLSYYYQQGGPYLIDADEYYIFDKSNGDIVEFDNLFTSDIKDKVYEYVAEYLKGVYSESEIEYDPEDYDLKDNMFQPGYYVLLNNKLSFSFPRSSFTAAAFGNIKIDIDEKIYKDYIKDIK